MALALRLTALNGGSFPYGTTPDHYIVSYVSGATSLPSITLYGLSETVIWPLVAAPGPYSVSIQAYDASSSTLGSPVVVPFTVPAVPAPAIIPVALRFVGSVGANSLVCQILFQPLGSLAIGQTIDHAVISLTGPSTATQTITFAGMWPQTVTFSSGIVNGNYSYSIQTYDSTSTAFGPAMISGPGGISYYDDTLTSVPIKLPTVEKSITVTPSTSGVGGQL